MRNLALAEQPVESTVARAAWSDARWLVVIVAAGFAIRLYLALTSFCISGDGAAYIRMARDFDSGNWRAPLGAVFSPLYPLLIAGAHHLIPDWEMAGNLASVLMGTGAIVAIYLLMREVFARREISLGAAALMAIHPDMAAYSASVRTEAGYVFLTTLAVWMLLRSINRRRIADAGMAGVIAGLAYLYRTEAIGLVALGVAFPLAASLIWKRSSAPMAAAFSGAFLMTAGIFVIGYMLCLHQVTGRWSVGREFTAAMMFGMSGVAHNTAAWRNRGFMAQTSAWSAIAGHPWIYLRKVQADLIASIYDFVQAANPLIFILLIAGLWTRGRTILASYVEAFPAIIVLFYFFGFALSYTGERFMSHLIPFTFGWVIVGLEQLSLRLLRFAEVRGFALPFLAPAALVALVLLPQTLWPIGYDQRGMRYAGEMIATANPDNRAVIARDGRVAWYAHAPFVALPQRAASDVCGWLDQHHAGYVLIGNRDEHRLAINSGTRCVQQLARYSRYGGAYYDLYRVKTEGAR